MRRLSTAALVLTAAGLLACASVPVASPTGGPPRPTTAVGTPAGTPSPQPTASPVASPVPSPTRPAAPTEGRDPERISAATFDDIALAVDRDGHAHALASRANDGLYYLTDASGSWIAEGIARPPAGGADQELEIAVDEDGTVHVVFARWSAWHPCTFECPPDPSVFDGLYHLSGTAAGGWSEARRLPFEVPPEEGIDGLDVAVVGGQIHLTLRRWSDGPDVVTYATNANGEWRFEQAIEDGWGARVAVSSDGSPVIAYTYGHEAGYGIGYAERAAAGSFSSQRVPATEAGLWPHLALDRQDRPHIVYGHDDGRSYYTYLDAAGWSLPMPVTRHIVAAAALDSRAGLHLIYDIGDGDAREGLWYATNRSGDLEAVQVDRRVRWVEDGPLAPSALAVDDAGRGHILYGVLYAEQGNGLWYAIVPGVPGD